MKRDSYVGSSGLLPVIGSLADDREVLLGEFGVADSFLEAEKEDLEVDFFIIGS